LVREVFPGVCAREATKAEGKSIEKKPADLIIAEGGESPGDDKVRPKKSRRYIGPSEKTR